MARLSTIGFEQNSTTNGHEFNLNTQGAATIVTSPVRSGTYAGRVSAMTSGAQSSFGYQFSTSDANVAFVRFYIYVVTRPSAANSIMRLNRTTGAVIVAVGLNSTGTLQLWDEDAAIGAVSPVLALNTWYRVEVQIDRSAASGSHIVRGRLDGVEWAGSATRALGAGVANLRFGGNLNLEAQTQGEWLLDDIAINDNTGAAQTSYPGDGKIIRLKPNAQGDQNGWLKQGVTPGDATSYQSVDEVTPDDATTFLGASVVTTLDSHNMEPSGLSASDTVNVVHVDGRHRNNVADATAAITYRLKKTSGGTITSSAAVVPNSTTWTTNGALPRRSVIVAYTDPDGAAWTSTTLDSMQVGYVLSTGGVNRIDVTAVSATVDYSPAEAKSGTAATSATTAATSTGGKQHTATSSTSATTAATGTETTARTGTTPTLTATSDSTASGVAARTGSTATSSTTAVTNTSARGTSADAVINHTVTVTATGVKAEDETEPSPPPVSGGGSVHRRTLRLPRWGMTRPASPPRLDERTGTARLTHTTATSAAGGRNVEGATELAAASSVSAAGVAGRGGKAYVRDRPSDSDEELLLIF